MPQTEQILTPTENEALSRVLRRYRGQGSQALLPCLHDVQAITRWLDEATCTSISKSLSVPLIQIHNVIEFYELFYSKPVGRRIIRVCDDMPCYLAGSEHIVKACAKQLGLAQGSGTTADGQWTLEIHPCLGRCEQAPFLMIDDQDNGHVKVDSIPKFLRGIQ